MAGVRIMSGMRIATSGCGPACVVAAAVVALRLNRWACCLLSALAIMSVSVMMTGSGADEDDDAAVEGTLVLVMLPLLAICADGGVGKEALSGTGLTGAVSGGALRVAFESAGSCAAAEAVVLAGLAPCCSSARGLTE